MDTFALTELVAALTGAGLDGNTLIIAIIAGVLWRVFAKNGFARAADVKGLGASLDRMREESVHARAEIHTRIDGIVKEQGELREKVAVLNDRSTTGRCS